MVLEVALRDEVKQQELSDYIQGVLDKMKIKSTVGWPLN